MPLATAPPFRFALVLSLLAWAPVASAQITLESSFDPSEDGSLCGIGWDGTTGNVWVYTCSGASINGYAPDGTLVGSVPRPGESANDVDLTFANVDLTLGTTAIPAGTLLFINGESGPADIYAMDPATGAVIDTLATAFGVSHVVGGGYHAGRDAFFLVQDRVPGGETANRVAEVSPVTGDTVRTFQTTPDFDVNYGDLDAAPDDDRLFAVSSIETTIAEFTPEGEFVTEHALPGGVSGLSGIALDCDASEAWVAGMNGTVWRLGQMPCAGSTSAEAAAPQPVSFLTAHPNPFTAQSTVVLEIGEAQHLRLAAYDVLGREVAVLHDGPVAPGEHRFAFRGRDLPSGAYLVRAVGETFAATRRVTRID